MIQYTDADLAALKKAYASGTLEVQFENGRRVRYATGNDLLARIREIETNRMASSPTTRGPSVEKLVTRFD